MITFKSNISMPFISRLQRSVLALALFFLTIMTLLRAVTWFVFKPAGETPGAAWRSFVLGLRFDARIIAIPVVLLLLLGSIKILEPFTTRVGKKLWLFVVIIFQARCLI